MSTDGKKNPNELGVAFTANGPDQIIPEDTIGTVWATKKNDRTGKRLFRGKINVAKIPVNLDGDFLHIVMFPFTVGEQTGISIQVSSKMHGKQEEKHGSK